MKKKELHKQVLRVALLFITLAVLSSCGRESETITESYDPKLYIYDESLEVASYPDIRAQYKTSVIYASNIELRGNELTLTLSLTQKDGIDSPYYGATIKGNVEIATDLDFSDKLEYKGVAVYEEEQREVYVYSLSSAQLDNAQTLYVQFPVIWAVIDTSPLSKEFDSHSKLPDTSDFDYGEDGVYTGDMGGFVARYKDKEWFSVTQIKRWRAKDSANRSKYYVTMQIESLGTYDYLPGSIFLYANDSNGRFASVDSEFDDPLSFAKGSKAMITFKVSKSTYKNFKNCEFYIRDISDSEICDSVFVINAED